MINTQQQIFLERYQNEKGDVYAVLDSMGLETHHLLSWRKLPEFDRLYRDTQRQVISFLNSENYVIGLRRLNTVLETGQDEETITTKQRVIQNPNFKGFADADTGEIPAEITTTEFETTRKVVKKGVPAQMIAIALQQNSLIQAINTLTSQGILPESIARKILAKSESIAADMAKVFEGEKQELEMSQAKAVELLKIAVLKGINGD